MAIISVESKWWPWLLCGGAWLLLIPLIAVTEVPQSDVANRYAPMAEAFARGDWLYAFHPRVAPLTTTAAGLICRLTGWSGFTGMQVVSAAGFALGVFPLYGILRRVYGASTAIVGGVLYLFCSHLLRLGASGLRDSAKGLGWLLAVWALCVLWQNRRDWRGYAGLAGGLAILSLVRGDNLVFVALLGLTAAGIETKWRYWPWRSALSGLVLLALVAPWLAYNYVMVGYPVSDVRLAAACRAFGWSWLANPAPRLPLSIAMDTWPEPEDNRE